MSLHNNTDITFFLASSNLFSSKYPLNIILIFPPCSFCFYSLHKPRFLLLLFCCVGILKLFLLFLFHALKLSSFLFQFGMLETVLTCIQDEFPKLRKYKGSICLGCGICCFFFALPCVCPVSCIFACLFYSTPTIMFS